MRPPAARARTGTERLLVVLASTAAVAVLSGCGGKIPPTHYYVLDLPAPPMQRAEPLPRTAIVMPFRASEMLIQDRIVYRPTKEEVGYYEYHRWAEDPRTTVTSSILNQLRARGTFSRIVPFDGRTKADYVIRGRIERLEEVDFESGVSVYVRLSAELVDVSTSKPIWQGVGEGSGQVTLAEVRDVVAEMSRAALESIEKLASDLDAYLRSSESRPASSSSLPPRSTQN